MSILSVRRVRCLSLGVQVLDDVFPGFKLGDFAVLHGHASAFMSFVLSVRCQLPCQKGGLGSSVVFVDGGNMFSPYSVAEIARGYGLNSKLALERIYVSRVFTAYQLSSLILEKLEIFLRKKRAKFLVVSSITSLFLDKNIPNIEAEDLFVKICTKLSEIAAEKSIVVVNYLREKRSRRNLFFEAVLFGRSNVQVRFKRRKHVLSFILEDHPHVKPFSMDLPTVDYSSLTDFMEA